MYYFKTSMLYLHLCYGILKSNLILNLLPFLQIKEQNIKINKALCHNYQQKKIILFTKWWDYLSYLLIGVKLDRERLRGVLLEGVRHRKQVIMETGRDKGTECN